MCKYLPYEWRQQWFCGLHALRCQDRGDRAVWFGEEHTLNSIQTYSRLSRKPSQMNAVVYSATTRLYFIFKNVIFIVDSDISCVYAELRWCFIQAAYVRMPCHTYAPHNSIGESAQTDHCMLFGILLSVIALCTESSRIKIFNKSVNSFDQWWAFARPIAIGDEKKWKLIYFERTDFSFLFEFLISEEKKPTNIRIRTLLLSILAMINSVKTSS